MQNEKQFRKESIITRYINKQEEPKLLLDVGIGPKTEYLTLAKFYPKMSILGLEPNPELFSKLKFKFNGLILPYAVSYENGETKFFLNHLNEGGSTTLIPESYNNTTEYKVPVKTLDWIDNQYKFPNNILLWMDIEGSELNALKGATRLLESGKVTWINLEARPKNTVKPGGCSMEELDEYLRKYGYQKCLMYNYADENKHRDIIYIKKGYQIPNKGIDTIIKHEAKVGYKYSDVT